MPDVDITMHTLHVRDHQEGGSIFVPSGDEPYFIAVGFRSAFRSAGSTQTFTNAYRNAKWAAGIKRGQSRDIPSGMGNITFRNVRLRSERDILAGQLPEIIGAVVVAMESDATPWPLIDALVGQIRTATHTEIKGLIESAPMGIPSHEAISGAVRNVFKAMDLRVWQKIGLWMGSWTDPDDPIGYHLFVMPAIDASAERLVKLPANTPGTAVRVQPFSTRIVFVGDGAHYEVQAAVRLTQPSWRYCRKCQALFYDGMNEKGVCAGRGAHEAAG